MKEQTNKKIKQTNEQTNEQKAKSNPTTCCVRIHMLLKFLFVIQFVRTYMTYFRVKYDDAVNVYLNG